MAHLSWILLWFDAISGLSINLEKSPIMSMGNVEDLEVLAFELGCKTMTLPTAYLGLPLGMRCNVVSVWDGVQERFRRILVNWKR